MPDAVRMEFSVKFDERLVSRLKQLDYKTQNSIQSKSIRAAWKVVLKEARKDVPKQTRALWRNLAVSVKRDRGKNMMTGRVIGRNKKDKQTGRNPARYLHLVEGGTRAHTIYASEEEKRLAIGATVWPRSVDHPGSRAQRFLMNAFRRKWRQAEAVLADKLEHFITKS